MSIRADVVEQFFGVYLLYCKNPEFVGKTYIGYTVDPNRRIKQHNKGRIAGGARKTSNKGPWVMAMIIHGFPNNISALRFEWAWQSPLSSRRLAHRPGIKKSRKESLFQYNIRVLSVMLNTGPWNRLPLTVRWLADDLVTEFAADKFPPMHMPICYGPVISKKIPSSNSVAPSITENISKGINCYLCDDKIDDDLSHIVCLSPECLARTHMLCLASRFLEPGEYVPVQGACPKCHEIFLWGDLIRKIRGCYGELSSGDTESNYNSDSDFDLD